MPRTGPLYLFAAFSAISFGLMLLGMLLGLISAPLMPWIVMALALATMLGPGRYIKQMA